MKIVRTRTVVVATKNLAPGEIASALTEAVDHACASIEDARGTIVLPISYMTTCRGSKQVRSQDDEADIVMNDNLLIASITFETQKQE